MSQCKHQNLVLLAPPKDRIRCRHCHLTLKRDELTKRYCPECYEAEGVRRSDFDEVEEPKRDKAQYSCEDCGLLIPTDLHDKQSSQPLDTD